MKADCNRPAARRAYRRGTGIPDPRDVHVGVRIRLRRMLLGMSLETVGAAIGLSYQQLQKYETGTNTITASRLLQIARVLEVPISYFFFEMSSEGAAINLEDKEWNDLMSRPETFDLIRSFYAIGDERVRAEFVALTVAAAQNRSHSDAPGDGV